MYVVCARAGVGAYERQPRACVGPSDCRGRRPAVPGGLAAEPATRSGQIIAQNVRSVVGDAIAHANDAAEAQRRAQAASRVKYIQRRGLATVPQAPAKRSVPPSLLFRLAAIRKAEESALDEDLVAQLFPMWKTEDGWNQSEVLKDLILAVSHLAYIAEASGV